jgi:hypothetical protein
MSFYSMSNGRQQMLHFLHKFEAHNVQNVHRICKLQKLRAALGHTEWKAVYVDYSDRLQRAQIDRPE